MTLPTPALDEAFVGPQGWLEPIIGGTEVNSRFVSLSDTANSGGVFGTETFGAGAPGGEGAWAIGAFAINNNAVSVQTAWSSYMESRRYATCGTTQGLEICSVNEGDVRQSQPYYMGQTGSTLGLWLNAGRSDVSPNNSPSLALGIIGSGTVWDRGIMFAWNSVNAGPVGPVAMGMPPNYALAWYLNDGGSSLGVGVPCATITSTATSVAGLSHPPALIFGNGNLVFDPGNNVDAMNLGVNLNVFQTSEFSQTVKVDGGFGVFGTTPVGSKPTVTGSRGSNAALASLLTAMASYGFITDSTT